MNILAVDTSSEWGSVAIRSRGRVVAEAERHSTDGFAHLVFPAIAEALDAASLALDEIDCFAAGSGPGSFTGVRVALSVAKGLAEANGKAAAGISNLRALATQSQAIRRAVLLDARRGDVYAAVYDPDLNAISPEVVSKLGPWLDSLEPAEYEFIALAGAPFLEASTGRDSAPPPERVTSTDLGADSESVVLRTSSNKLQHSRFGEMALVTASQSRAASIALCAEIDGHAGRWSDPALLDANYVRRSDAEMFWREA